MIKNLISTLRLHVVRSLLFLVVIPSDSNAYIQISTCVAPRFGAILLFEVPGISQRPMLKRDAINYMRRHHVCIYVCMCGGLAITPEEQTSAELPYVHPWLVDGLETIFCRQ